MLVAAVHTDISTEKAIAFARRQLDSMVQARMASGESIDEARDVVGYACIEFLAAAIAADDWPMRAEQRALAEFFTAIESAKRARREMTKAEVKPHA